MKQPFDDIAVRLIEREGGFVDDPADLGGTTRYGITEATARQYGYTGAMEDLPLSLAVEIYRRNYWAAIKGDELAGVAGDELAEAVFDFAVLGGPSRAARLLQEICNVFGQSLARDGILGPASLSAVGSLDAEALRIAYAGRVASYFLAITEARPENRRFLKGWLTKRVWL